MNMKGFFTSILLLSFLIFLILSINSSADAKEGIQSMKNVIILQQRISEAQYSMQHDFENAVKKGRDTQDLTDIEKSILICSKIKQLNFTVKQGCITEDYEIDEFETNSVILKDSVKNFISKDYLSLFEAVEPCVKFIRQEEKAVVGLNTKLDYENNLVYCINSGFILEKNVSNHLVKTIIPMEAEI